ncbi:hypothetical protein SHKM778_54710 [Streptomyces sp. KM77-8]|uniref:SDR family NAD(P)-dependent oxidoreductase n=1 Tax=Streptomyces haneummycinicus TaxID=3074435 RepID=A0AAT9HNQ1_9ACTN
MTVTQDGLEATDAVAYGPGIDPARLAVCLDVLRELDELDVDHPDAIMVRRATSHIYRTVKQRRRQERRAAKTAHDKAVTEATATGSAERIDDETEGILPSSQVEPGKIAGILQRPRSCYTCKTRYTEVDYFYHQLCQNCAAENRARRDARADLTGKRALLTGGRAKIGMYIALRLLRDGAHTTITTRFPKDAIRRFKAMDDSAEWMHRLEVVGIDLRDPAQAVALADRVAEQGPLDILINNATQTVRRLPSAYAALVDGEGAPCRPVSCPPTTSSAPSTPARSTDWPRCPSASADSRHRRWPTSPWSRATPAWSGTARAPPSTRAACCPTSSTPTPGSRPSSRSPRWNCWRPSSATTRRRSS